jgi:tellurium resistance protein TerZ
MAISLSKGETVSLDKGAGQPRLKKVRVGLGWDVAADGPAVDLDASALLFSGSRHLTTVFFGNLAASGVSHGGDNLTGEGDGDDEQITVDLDQTGADTIAFTVNSYSGHTFSQVSNAYCRLVDVDTSEELARATLGEKQSHTGIVLAVLQNVDNKWEMTSVCHFADGRTGSDMVPVIQGLLTDASA